jgi:hypothetical protein
VRATEPWDVANERYRHDQAVYTVGEPAYFIMLWREEDQKAGLVNRCSRCFGTGTITDRTAAVYNQPTQNKCPRCYGTTFDGGIRASIIRPAIFSDSDDAETIANRGVVHPQHSTVESTSDFRTRAGDFVFRADGSRWQLGAPTRVTLRTGFNHPTQVNDSMGYATMPATLEDLTSVAYIIPPNAEQIQTRLVAPIQFPSSPVDAINGPLIPRGFTD